VSIDSASKNRPFVCDLSTSEFLLSAAAGFKPAGLVFGCSVFHAGTRPRLPTAGSEVGYLSQALYAARQDAIGRMEHEAHLLHASGVIGIRLTLRTSEWSRKSVEFIAVGTAVTATDGSDWRTDDGKPFTSDLSGREFWTVLRSGFRPLGFVMGTCVYQVGRRDPMTAVRQVRRNSELRTQTQALYSARELSLSRMQDEGIRLGAAGVVGSRVTESSHVWRHRLIEFLAIGTAIKPIATSRPDLNPWPALSVDH
jgi:uncharacterized protein YbjQ (UPF0145 family)